VLQHIAVNGIGNNPRLIISACSVHSSSAVAADWRSNISRQHPLRLDSTTRKCIYSPGNNTGRAWPSDQRRVGAAAGRVPGPTGAGPIDRLVSARLATLTAAPTDDSISWTDVDWCGQSTAAADTACHRCWPNEKCNTFPNYSPSVRLLLSNRQLAIGSGRNLC